MSKNCTYVAVMKTDPNTEHITISGLHIDTAGNEVFGKRIAATNIAIFHGNKADPVSLCWNDNNNETDNNVICSNTNINDDKQNKKTS